MSEYAKSMARGYFHPEHPSYPDPEADKHTLTPGKPGSGLATKRELNSLKARFEAMRLKPQGGR